MSRAIAVLLLALLPLFDCNAQSVAAVDLTPDERAWLAEHPSVRLGVDPSYAPYSFVDDQGVYQGVAMDFVEMIEARLPLTLEVVPGLDWPQIIGGSRDGTVDVVLTASWTQERTEFLEFTELYLPTPLVLMTRTGDDRFQSAADLAGKRVALVKRYSSSERVVAEHPDAEPMFVATPLEGLWATARGAADAYVGVIGVNVYEARKNGITNLKVACEYDDRGNGQCLAVRKDWAPLASILQKTLDTISEEERMVVTRKWIDLRVEQRTDWAFVLRAILITLAISAVGFGVFGVVNRRLAREVEERKRAEAEAAAANAAKSEFLANMSHEIRTPMNAILGYSELLKRQLQDPTQQKYLDGILVSGRSLLTLINDILDLSKIESGYLAIEPRPTNLTSLLEELELAFGNKVEEKGLDVVLKVSPRLPGCVMVDEVRLRQVLFNLIGNAVKFTDHGTITVGVEATSRTAEACDLEISVADTGIGIPAGDLDQVFQKFQQATGQRTAQYGGTGLGLSICKQLVGLMGGVLSVTSEVGRGSVFSIRLTGVPIGSPDALRQTETPAVQGTLRGARLLVADDNAVNQEVASALLEDLGAVVRTVSNGREALAALEDERYDAVLMDVQMPGMNGLEATRALRANPKHVELPVVAMTARAMAGDRAACLAAGMSDYLTKPIDPRALLETLARWIVPSGVEEPDTATEPEADLPALPTLASDLSTKPRTVAVFLKHAPTQWEDLRDAKDHAARQGCAHKLVGSCGAVGAARLGALCRRIEASPAEGAALEELLAEIEAELGRVIAALEAKQG